MTDAMDVAIERRGVDPRLDPRLDPRIDIGRDSARANTASRIDPRPDRMADSRSTEPAEKYVTDPMTGQVYRQVPARPTYPRDDRDYIEPPASRNGHPWNRQP